MGKKSKDLGEDTVKSLFSFDNPFRRKPQQDAAAVFAADIPQPTPKLGLVLDSSPNKRGIFTEAKIQGDDAVKARKRKRDKVIKAATPSSPSSDEELISRKRKKLVEEAKGEESKNKKKRKRDEEELENEKRKQLNGVDEAAVAATVVAVGEKRKADVAAADMLNTNKPFDDESKLLRTVFVGNLPLNIKRKALNREFAKFGEIESVRIRSVPLVDTKFPRKTAVYMGKINQEIDSVNAYIVFKEEQSAQTALSQNMTQVGGNHIRVDMACPPRKKMKGESLAYDRKKTAFVGNLPFDVKDEELYQLFCDLSPSEPNVEAVRVIRDSNTSAGKGFAYVLFKTRADVNKVCWIKDLKIRDRLLRVCHVKSDAVPSNKAKEGTSRSFTRRSPATGFRETPSGKGEKRKIEAASSVTYEGTRSSKKGTVKKTSSHHFPSGKSVKGSTRSSWSGKSVKDSTRSSWSGKSVKGSTRSSLNVPKGRTKKRPAVAARKAEQLKKRKQAGGMPNTTYPNKRVRRQ